MFAEDGICIRRKTGRQHYNFLLSHIAYLLIIYWSANEQV